MRQAWWLVLSLWALPAWATDVPMGSAPTEVQAPPAAIPPPPAALPASPAVVPPPPALPRRPDGPLPWQPPPAPAAQPARAGLGITGSLSYGVGFTYQRLFGRGNWQVTGVPLVWDRGDNAVASLGTSFALYPWLSSGRWVGPRTDAALRVVAGASAFYNARTTTSSTLDASVGADGIARPVATTVTRDRTLWLNAGLGVGFEFGAIQQAGFSVALDLLWTATWAHTPSEGWHMRQVLPLPAGNLIYHW